MANGTFDIVPESQTLKVGAWMTQQYTIRIDPQLTRWTEPGFSEYYESISPNMTYKDKPPFSYFPFQIKG